MDAIAMNGLRQPTVETAVSGPLEGRPLLKLEAATAVGHDLIDHLRKKNGNGEQSELGKRHLSNIITCTYNISGGG